MTGTVHEVLTSMIEHWAEKPVEDVDEFLLSYEAKIHMAYHSLWMYGRQPVGQERGLFDVKPG